MHIFLICDLSKFQNVLPNIDIWNSIETDVIFGIFQFPNFCVPCISKTNEVINWKKKKPKSCAHLSHATCIC